MATVASQVIAALDETVEQYLRQTRRFHEPLTVGRARMFVMQHRLNTRHRNSVLKPRVATLIPDWDLRVRLLGAATQEIIADNEFADGKPHWQILKELGLAIGLTAQQIDEAEPLPSTRIAWLAWEGLMSNHHWLEGLIGATMAERINVPGYGEGLGREQGWAAVEYRRWRELFDLSDEQMQFFKVHREADKAHSDLGWEGVARYACDLHMEDAALAAARDTLNIWSMYFDGIWAGGDALDRAG